MKQLLMACLLLAATLTVQAQSKYITKTGRIEFLSKAPLEDIEAQNKTAAALLDTKTGDVQFSVLMKAFQFPKALMQEHFNSNYVESNKYPTADFKGTITNNADIRYTKDGTYTAKVKGTLTIHGVSKNIVSDATLKVNNGKIDANTVFSILLSDYKITRSGSVKDKLSNTITITVTTSLEPLKG